MLLDGLCNSAAADVMVQWGGNYVSQAQTFADHVPGNASGSDKYGDPSAFVIGADSIAGRALSTDSALSPGSGYSGTSSTFYGGGSVTRTNSVSNDGFSDLSVLNQGPTNDSLHFHVDTGGDSHTFHLLTYYWDKADFLNGLNAVPNLTFDPGGKFALTTAQSAGHHTDEVLRWVVRNGSNFYVSQATATLTNNSTLTALYSTLTNWALYSPADPAGAPTAADLQSLDFDESGPHNVLSSTFTNITGLGFYVEHESATQQVNFHVESFQASAAAVPEPSSVGLGLIGLAGFAVRRYRSRHTADRSAEA